MVTKLMFHVNGGIEMIKPVKLMYWKRIMNGDKIPRMAKKKILGTKWSKSKLKKNIKLFKVIYKQKHLYEASTYTTEPFCPNCGCRHVTSTGNMAEHPEYWVANYCLRCGTKVAEADNSVFYHILEDMQMEEFESKLLFAE